MQSLSFFLHHNSAVRLLGRSLDRNLRSLTFGTLNFVLPTPVNQDLPDVDAVHSILIVRSNFRIGNVVLATALLPLLQARFPHASIDFLVGDKSAALLGGQPLRQVHLMSRRFIYMPWKFFALFHRLRKERFDLAVDAGMGSFSGALFAWLSGARCRMGVDGRHQRFLTTRLKLPANSSIYDSASNLGRALGVEARTLPSYHVTPEESTQALAWLHEVGLAQDGKIHPFLGVFVGGNLKKRWPHQYWLELIGQLNIIAVQSAVFVGPNERGMLAPLRSEAGSSVHVVPPQPLRRFVSLLACADLFITPDSGAMHLAAAMQVPVIAVLQKECSRFYVPPGASNRTLIRPDVAALMRALREHPHWQTFGLARNAKIKRSLIVNGAAVRQAAD